MRYILGNSPGLFGGDGLASRNNFGAGLLACENSTIQREGFLIGWQYFLKNHTDQCGDSSYATVYRRGSGTTYAHVASTRLQPTHPTRDGINFQFVQTMLIPVQIGDVVGIYTSGCEGTGKNIVSAQVGGGRAHKSGKLVGTGYTFTDFNANMLLSLKAYTAGREL